MGESPDLRGKSIVYKMDDAFVHVVFALLLGVVVAMEAKHKLLPRCVAKRETARERQRERERPWGRTTEGPS